MKRRRWVLLMVVVGVVAVLSATHTYHVARDEGSGQAFYNEKECFILVGVHYMGWHGNGFATLLELGRMVLGFAPGMKKHDRRDTIVFHIKEGKIRRVDIKGMYAGGPVYPHQGVPYSAGRRWDGTTFQRLSTQDAERIEAEVLNAVPPGGFGAWLEQQGWHEVPNLLTFREASKDFQLSVDGRPLVISVSQSLSPRWKQLVVRLPQGEQVSEKFEAEPKRVSSVEYFRIFDSDEE